MSVVIIQFLSMHPDRVQKDTLPSLISCSLNTWSGSVSVLGLCLHGHWDKVSPCTGSWWSGRGRGCRAQEAVVYSAELTLQPMNHIYKHALSQGEMLIKYSQPTEPGESEGRGHDHSSAGNSAAGMWGGHQSPSATRRSY